MDIDFVIYKILHLTVIALLVFVMACSENYSNVKTGETRIYFFLFGKYPIYPKFKYYYNIK